MNMGIIIVIALLALWGLGVFLGIVGGLSKPFSNNTSPFDSSSIKSQEQQTIEETKAKQQKMMEDMKDKMRDAVQKF